MSNLISKNEFYVKFLENSNNCLETIDDKDCDKEVRKQNMKVLIDLCDKRLALEDHSHNSRDNEDNDKDGDNDYSGSDSGQQSHKSIESAEKWLIEIQTTNGSQYICGFNDCQSLSIFENKTDALAHVWGHTGDRPYKCGESGCDYSGRTKSHLSEHTLSHTIEKCAISDCDNHDSDTEERDERKSEQILEESIKIAEKWLININTAKVPRFKCVFNDCHSLTVFKNKTDALAHVWGHTGHRPYKCGVSGCGYSGRTKYLPWKHSLSHREKSTKCSISDRKLRSAKHYSLKTCVKSKHNSDDNHNIDNLDSDKDESCLNGQQSEQTIEKSVESAEKWLTKIMTTNGKRYKCEFNGCQSDVYIEKFQAFEHVWGHTGDRPFKCGVNGCDYSGRRKEELKEHSLSHIGEKTYKCQISDNQTIMESTDRAKKWINEVNINDNIYYKCTFDRNCEIKSRSISSVVRHVWAHTDESPFKCDHKGCDYGCRSALQLKEHWLSHSGHETYKCRISDCENSTARHRNLSTHMEDKDETGRRVFVRNHSGGQYHNSDDNSTDVYHNSDTDEACLIEQQSDKIIKKSRKTAKKWITKVKINNNTYHKCTFDGSCTYKSKFRSNVVQHVWGHTGDRPYKCGVNGCDYSGRTAPQLCEHTLSHTGQKPYKCEQNDCDYSYKRREDLVRHMQAKHSTANDRLYKCRQTGCQYRTKVWCYYRKHVRQTHFSKMIND